MRNEQARPAMLAAFGLLLIRQQNTRNPFRDSVRTGRRMSGPYLRGPWPRRDIPVPLINPAKAFGFFTAGLIIAYMAGSFASAGGASLSDTWIRWLPGDLAMAGYFTLQNHSGRALRLTGVDAPDFKSAELHKSVEKNGEAKMIAVDTIKVAPDGKVIFKPGGYHIMLMHRRHPIKRGDHLPITLKFSNGSQFTASFPVKSPTGQ